MTLTKSQKVIVGIIVAVAIILGLWMYIDSATAPAVTNQNASDQSQNSSSEESLDENASSGSDTMDNSTAQQNAEGDSTSTTSPNDTSDSAIDKDLSSIDSQIGNLGIDSAGIDQGLNDQPIEQEQ